jgi:hypothetical protein
MKLIRQLLYAGTIMQGEKLSNFKSRMPDEHDTLIAEVEREAFGRGHSASRARQAGFVNTRPK